MDGIYDFLFVLHSNELKEEAYGRMAQYHGK